MRKFLAAIAVVLLTLSPAMSADRVQVGRLSCDVEAGFGLIIGSSKDITCTFHPDSGSAHTFTGSINKIGLDIGITQKTHIEWLVFAAGHQALSHNAIAGTYVGASAEASLGLGGGVNWLIGGDRDAFMLQPWSVQGQIGINLAVGLTGLTIH